MEKQIRSQRVTRRVTSFRDLARPIKSRIKQIDAALRTRSLPTLRKALEEIKWNKKCNQETAKWVAVFRNRLLEGKTPEENFFLNNSPFGEVQLIAASKYIYDMWCETPSNETEWLEKDTWRETYLDKLSVDQQKEFFDWLKNRRDYYNADRDNCGALIEYLEGYLDGCGISPKTYDKLLADPERAAKDLLHECDFFDDLFKYATEQ